MSTKNFRNSESPTGAPAARFPYFVKNLNKFYEFCGSNDSEAARRLGVRPQQFNEWRKGDHVPASGTRKHIAAKLRIDEHTLMHGESSQHFGPPPLSSEGQRILERFERSIRKADMLSNEKLLAQIKGQMEVMEILVDKAARDLNPAVGATMEVIRDVATAAKNIPVPATTPADTERRRASTSEKRGPRTPSKSRDSKRKR